MAIGQVMGRPEDVVYRAVAVGSASVTLPKGSRFLIISDTNCWIAFGKTPTAAAATAPSIYLPANTPMVFERPVVGAATLQTAALKVAAIRVTADGTLTIVGLA